MERSRAFAVSIIVRPVDRPHRFISRRARQLGHDDDDPGRGWFGDPEGHSEASRRGWEGRRGDGGRSLRAAKARAAANAPATMTRLNARQTGVARAGATAAGSAIRAVTPRPPVAAGTVVSSNEAGGRSVALRPASVNAPGPYAEEGGARFKAKARPFPAEGAAGALTRTMMRNEGETSWQIASMDDVEQGNARDTTGRAAAFRRGIVREPVEIASGSKGVVELGCAHRRPLS